MRSSTNTTLLLNRFSSNVFTFAAIQFEGEANLPNHGDRQFLSGMLLLHLHSNNRYIAPVLDANLELKVLVCNRRGVSSIVQLKATLTFGKVQQFVDVAHSVVLGTVHSLFKNIRVVIHGCDRLTRHDLWMGRKCDQSRRKAGDNKSANHIGKFDFV